MRAKKAAAMEDGYNGKETGRVPLLPEDVEIDDKDATLVFLFPKEEEAGGVVDPDEDKENPLQEARKIFYQHHDFYPGKLTVLDDLAAEDSVSEGQYQEIVRRQLLQTMQNGGIHASSSESIDKDEVFLKVSFGLQSARLAHIAEHYRYMMPMVDGLSASSPTANAYEHLENADGMPVPMYTEFAEAVQDKVEPFRPLDEIRLLHRWLSDRINLEELKSQGIILGHFPATAYGEILELSADWAALRFAPCPATAADHEQVRGYFGEQIAFFFTWFAHYNEYLMVLAAAAMVIAWRKKPGLDPTITRWIQNGFAVLLVFWVAGFNELFKRKSNRLKQLWGMKDWDNQQADTMNSYREDLEGTRMGQMLKTAATTSIALYLIFFAGLILLISMMDKDLRDAGDMRLAKWSPYIISIIMKVCSFIWGKLAIKLVAWENHRTEARFNDALATTLALVKLFVALFPFVSLAFLESWVNQTCKHSLAEAAVSVYRHTGWPSGTNLHANGVPAQIAAANLTSDDLGFLHGYSNTNSGGLQCIYGCYPVDCNTIWHGSKESLSCQTNCWISLETQLTTYYILQVVSVAAMLVLPIVMTKVSVTLEIAKVNGITGTADLAAVVLRSVLGLRMATPPGGRSYSLLQYQAKCYSTAPYEYASFGGSYVEDFLELTIGYSLLACFAQIVPEMAIIGAFTHLIMYRILACRMLNVTCRPWPNGAEGIGIWQTILDCIATLAVTCNVALSCFLMSPIKFWKLEHKFLFFILAEKGLFSLRSVVATLLKDEPDDVIFIQDKNALAEKEITTRPLPIASDRHDFGGVDISLAAVQSDDEYPPKGKNGQMQASAPARQVLLRTPRDP